MPINCRNSKGPRQTIGNLIRTFSKTFLTYHTLVITAFTVLAEDYKILPTSHNGVFSGGDYSLQSIPNGLHSLESAGSYSITESRIQPLDTTAYTNRVVLTVTYLNPITARLQWTPHPNVTIQLADSLDSTRWTSYTNMTTNSLSIQLGRESQYFRLILH